MSYGHDVGQADLLPEVLSGNGGGAKVTAGGLVRQPRFTHQSPLHLWPAQWRSFACFIGVHCLFALRVPRTRAAWPLRNSLSQTGQQRRVAAAKVTNLLFDVPIVLPSLTLRALGASRPLSGRPRGGEGWDNSSSLSLHHRTHRTTLSTLHTHHSYSHKTGHDCPSPCRLACYCRTPCSSPPAGS